MKIGIQRGFTLIEVLVAVLVLSIGLLSLAALQGISLRNNHSAYLRTQANNIAYEVIDQMRAETDLLAAVPEAVMDEWEGQAAALLPAGEIELETTATADGTEVTVVVSWLDDRSQTADDQYVSFSVSSRL